MGPLHIDAEPGDGGSLMVCGAYIVHRSSYVHRLGWVSVLIHSLVAGTWKVNYMYISTNT